MKSEHENRIKARTLLPLSEATYLILLALTEPKHGYGIMQTVSTSTDGTMKLGPGTLYGALTNLLKQELIRPAGESGNSQDRRKIYSLTPLGRSVVEMEFERLESMVRIGRQILKQTRGTK